MMRSFFFLALMAGFVSFSTAQAQHLCEVARCSPPQLAIQQGYDAHPGFVSTNLVGGVFSGPCYYAMDSIDPNYQHLGLMLVEGPPDASKFRAAFMFYETGNPYAFFNFDQASDWLDSRRSNHTPITIGDDTGHVEFTSRAGTIAYYLRSDGQTMYLLSQWKLDTGGARFFCQFTRHAATPAPSVGAGASAFSVTKPSPLK